MVAVHPAEIVREVVTVTLKRQVWVGAEAEISLHLQALNGLGSRLPDLYPEIREVRSIAGGLCRAVSCM